jgi:hypothetical protein
MRAQRVLQREKGREISQVRWVIGKLAVEEAGYRLAEIARYLTRGPGVMSRGLRQLEERLENDRKLQTRIGKLQVGIPEGKKHKIVKRQG